MFSFEPRCQGACGSSEPDYPEGTLAAVLAADGRFTTFLEITNEIVGPHGTEVMLVRTEDRDRTVWAPTDDAFAALDPDLLEKLKDDPNCLSAPDGDLFLV